MCLFFYRSHIKLCWVHQSRKLYTDEQPNKCRHMAAEKPVKLHLWQNQTTTAPGANVLLFFNKKILIRNVSFFFLSISYCNSKIKCFVLLLCFRLISPHLNKHFRNLHPSPAPVTPQSRFTLDWSRQVCSCVHLCQNNHLMVTCRPLLFPS